jgi:hypothetical protein
LDERKGEQYREGDKLVSEETESGFASPRSQVATILLVIGIEIRGGGGGLTTAIPFEH